MKERTAIRNNKNWEFPYGAPETKRRFRGGNKLLEGYIEKTRDDVILGEGNGQMQIPGKTKYLEIHFDVDEVSIEDGEFRKVVKLLKKGSEDLLDLTKALEEKKKLQEIDLIVGTTNPRMARLAVKRFGFHYGNPEVLESRRKKREPEVTIFITKEELRRQKQKIKEVNGRLKRV